MTLTLRRLNTLTVALNALIIFVPLILFFDSLQTHGVWPNAIAAWRGEYVDPFFSQFTNPWLDILPTDLGLLLGYAILVWLAFRVFQIQVDNLLFRFRKLLSVLCLVGGSAALFYTSLGASSASTYFGNFLFPGYDVSPLVILTVVILSLAINLYLLFQREYHLMIQSGRKIDIIERLRHRIRTHIPIARETDAAAADLLAISFQSTTHLSRTVWIYSYQAEQIGIELETRTPDGEWLKDNQSLTVNTFDECLTIVSAWLGGTP